MSYGIMPYKIRLKALNEVLALRDETLCAWLLFHCEADLARLDDDDPDNDRPAEEYLADIMLGRPEVEEGGHLYGYCTELLCQLWGEMLDNDGWIGMNSAWRDHVTATVAEAGVDYDFADLIGGGPGLHAPCDVEPRIGHLTRSELQPNLDRLNAIDPTRLTSRQVAASVETVRSWLRQCMADDMDLVCFYY